MRIEGRLERQDGSVAVLGSVVQDSVQRNAPGPVVVAREFVKELRGRYSDWPSAGQTRNRGPQATGASARAFRARQGRSARGLFESRAEIINDAKNAKGIPYASFVDQGIYNWRASSARRKANMNAVRRTWRRWWRSARVRRLRERRSA